MKKAQWVLNSPDTNSKPPKKGICLHKMPDSDSEPETKPPSK